MFIDLLDAVKRILPVLPLNRYNTNVLSNIIYVDIEIFVIDDLLQMSQELICDCTIEYYVIHLFLKYTRTHYMCEMLSICEFIQFG